MYLCPVRLTLNINAVRFPFFSRYNHEKRKKDIAHETPYGVLSRAPMAPRRTGTDTTRQDRRRSKADRTFRARAWSMWHGQTGHVRASLLRGGFTGIRDRRHRRTRLTINRPANRSGVRVAASHPCSLRHVIDHGYRMRRRKRRKEALTPPPVSELPQTPPRNSKCPPASHRVHDPRKPLTSTGRPQSRRSVDSLARVAPIPHLPSLSSSSG